MFDCNPCPPFPAMPPVVKFGSDMPMGVTQGTLWWNGTVLALFDGAVWANVHTGAEIPFPK